MPTAGGLTVLVFGLSPVTSERQVKKRLVALNLNSEVATRGGLKNRGFEAA
jgi:hypothetical protein